jgi:tetraacyldisaccharide 4'-kinase
MKTPHFWSDTNWRSTLLRPASAVYAVGNFLHRKTQKPQRLAVPSLCIGNAVAGGAGKTPVVHALVRLLHQQGFAPHIVSRGYGGRVTDATRVDPHHHTTQEVGDEALLHAALAPCWVGRDRVGAAKAAIAAGAQLILFDDGLQHYALKATANLLVVDGASGFGNGKLLPAGPLREPVAAVAKRVQGTVLIGDAAQGVRSQLPLPVFAAKLEALEASAFKGRRVLAFAGLANPQKFYDMLTRLGVEVVQTQGFADHYAYTETDSAALLKRAKEEDLLPLTTAKDAVRLPADVREAIAVLQVQLKFEDETAVLHWLKEQGIA